MNIALENRELLVLDVPFHTQLNNDEDSNSGWWNECSYTSMAMFLRSFGFVGNGLGQFEDQIEKGSERDKLTRGEPGGMSWYMNQYFSSRGNKYGFSYTFTWDKVYECLQKGHPVIAHTWLTNSGHVLVIVGFNPDAYDGTGAWVCHDPYGEWYPSGYDTDASGECVEYSIPLSKRLIGTDGDLWIHYDATQR